jgi:hypothetical protein
MGARIGQPEHDRNVRTQPAGARQESQKGQPEEDNQNRKGFSLPLPLDIFLIIHFTTVFCKRQVKNRAFYNVWLQRFLHLKFLSCTCMTLNTSGRSSILSFLLMLICYY